MVRNSGGQIIAFTITYKQHDKVKPKSQFHRTIPHLYRRFRKVSDEFYIYPELHLDGNIHYHGWFIQKDRIKWHKSILPSLKLEGFVKIKYVFDGVKWRDYCEKEIEDMKSILDDQELPVTATSKKWRMKSRMVRTTYNALDNLLVAGSTA